MTEIYRGSTNTVTLNVEGDVVDETPTAVAYFTHAPSVVYPLTVSPGTDTVGPIAGPTDDVQQWTAPISFALSQEVGELTVHWEFVIDDIEGYKDDHFDVVVPLVELGDIRDELELPESQFDDWTLIRAERRVRRIIENATGQVFAPYNTSYKIPTTSSKKLRLPARLITATEFESNGFPLSVDNIVVGDQGWTIMKYKQYYVGSVIKSGAVIADPYAQLNAYWRGGGYVELTGKFGWERVPQGIYEAALILLEEILCPESAYRDRYLKTMTAADFRFEFDPGAYVGTGNVVADHILRDFRAPNLAAVL